MVLVAAKYDAVAGAFFIFGIEKIDSITVGEYGSEAVYLVIVNENKPVIKLV